MSRFDLDAEMDAALDELIAEGTLFTTDGEHIFDRKVYDQAVKTMTARERATYDTALEHQRTNATKRVANRQESPVSQLLNARVIRHQFRQNGLNHLAVVSEDRENYHVVFGDTFCGKAIPIGSGGWGYGPKDCPECMKIGAVAERITYPHEPPAPTDTYDEAQELYRLVMLAAKDVEPSKPHTARMLREWAEERRDLIAFGHFVDRDHYLELRDQMIDVAYEVAPGLPVDAGRSA